MKKGGTAAISAERGDKSKKRTSRSKALEKDIRGRGMGMTKATGKFVETDLKVPGQLTNVYAIAPGNKCSSRRKFPVARSMTRVRNDKQKPGLDAEG